MRLGPEKRHAVSVLRGGSRPDVETAGGGYVKAGRPEVDTGLCGVPETQGMVDHDRPGPDPFHTLQNVAFLQVRANQHVLRRPRKVVYDVGIVSWVRIGRAVAPEDYPLLCKTLAAHRAPGSRCPGKRPGNGGMADSEVYGSDAEIIALVCVVQTRSSE